MSDTKKHNSILFLTTLSVYLGLVLVGGANSPVLAQAALTRNFDIQEEIEYKDDLDKKPDDCGSLQNKVDEKSQKFDFNSQVINDYAEALLNLIELTGQISSNDFAFQAQSNFYSNNIRKLDFSFDLKPVLFPKDTRQNLDTKINNLYNLFPVDFQQDGISFSFDFDNSKSFLNTKVKFSGKTDLDAHKLSVGYDSSLDLWRCKTQSKPINVILRNTEVFTENNQVTIVTRLPRASIESLLAEKNAN
jgi:hypothetical protein